MWAMVLETFKEFLLVFTPLFVAIDPIGILPLFMALTSELTYEDKQSLITKSCLVAFIGSLIFLMAGKMIFQFLGITPDDFRIGGGCLLFLMAISDLVYTKAPGDRKPLHELAIVPIGIPLILGPASLTTIMIAVDGHGHLLTSVALLVNIVIVYLVFKNSKHLQKILGEGGSLAFAKIASLFLLAIAVMMIRVGLANSVALMHQ